jgi:hypothetical protein
VCGAPWRDLPEVFGEWNSVFRLSRLESRGVIESMPANSPVSGLGIGSASRFIGAGGNPRGKAPQCRPAFGSYALFSLLQAKLLKAAEFADFETDTHDGATKTSRVRHRRGDSADIRAVNMRQKGASGSPRFLREPTMFRSPGGDDTKLRPDETVFRTGEDTRKPALDSS